MIKRGRVCGERVRYPDGVGGCIWIPFPGEDDDTGICFDFEDSDLDDMIELLTALKGAEPAVYVPPEDPESLPVEDDPGERYPE